MLIIVLQNVERIGSPFLGIIIPSLVMIISIVLTWILYKRFSGKN